MRLAVFMYLWLTLIVENSGKLKEWASFINGSMFQGYFTCYNNPSSLTASFSCMYSNSKIIQGFISKNFVKHNQVKGIIGTIICCLSLMQTNYNYINQTWHFTLHIKLKIKVEVIFMDLGSAGTWTKSWRRIHNVRYEGLYLIDKFSSSARHQYFYYGRRGFFYLVSNKHKIMMIGIVFPTKEQNKLFSRFSIIDASEITLFKYNGYVKAYDKNHCRFQSRMWYYSLTFNNTQALTYHVTVQKTLKIVVKLNCSNTNYTLIFFDGPKDIFKQIKVRNNKVIFSSFQCYIKLYQSPKRIQPKEMMCICVQSLQQKLIKLSVANNNTKLSFDNWIRNRNNLIFNISSTRGYLNLSVLDFSFYGPNIDRCAYGGFSYVQSDGSKLHEIRNICDKYNHSSKNKSFNKTLMEFVATNQFVLLVIYSYAPISFISKFTLEISISSCRGIFPCKTGGSLNIYRVYVYNN